MSRLISCNCMWVGAWITCNQAKRPQLATARARLFYGQMINCYLTIRKREKGTNLTLEFGVSKQQISDMRKKKEERLDKALYIWFIHAAKVHCCTDFRPASSTKSETLPHAVKRWLTWSGELEGLNWLTAGKFQTATWPKKPKHSKRETSSGGGNCAISFTKATQSDRLNPGWCTSLCDHGTDLENKRACFMVLRTILSFSFVYIWEHVKWILT